MMTLAIFLLIIIFGYLLFSFWEREFPSFLERVALGFLIGLGFITLAMFFLGLLKISLTFGNLFLGALLAIFFLLVVLKINKKLRFTKVKILPLKNLIFFEKLLVGVIFFLFLWSLLQTLFWPPVTWDTLALYDFRALRFAETHSLAEEIFTREPELASYTYSYPFFTSLAHALVYIAGGENPMFIYTLFYLAFLIGFYHALKRISSRTIALLFTAFISFSQSFLYHSTIAYANLPHAVYFILSTIFLWRWLETKKNGFLLASTTFLGLSTWVRSEEPFWIVNIGFLVFYLLFQKKLLSAVANVLIFFAIRQPWRVYYKHVLKGIADPRLVQTSFRVDLGKIWPVTYFFLRKVIFVREWFLILFIFGLIILLEYRRARKHWYILGFVLSYFAILWMGIYYFSVNYFWWDKIGGSATRISFFLMPLLIYSVVFLLFGKSASFKKSKNIFKSLLEIKIFHE